MLIISSFLSNSRWLWTRWCSNRSWIKAPTRTRLGS